MATSPTATATSTTGASWDVDRLDLDAYLARLGVAGALGSGVGALAALHRAHVAAVPFENVDVVLGRPISLDLDAVQDKLVRRRRGGYCFEHNLLFAAALERLGHPVRRLEARVRPDEPGPRTHLTLVTEVAGRWHLADVGFGGQLLDPIPLAATEVRHGGWRYRLVPGADGTWRLETRRDGAWLGLYAFRVDPVEPVDCVMNNHFTSTHPASPFVGHLVAFRLEERRRTRLHDRRLTVSVPDGPDRVQDLTTDEAIAVLRDDIGTALTASEVAELRRLLTPVDGDV